MRPWRVISGGQTGVDRAALDAAIECGIPVGGWCPKRRRAEDGLVPHRYPLVETPSRAYAQRTTWNGRDADATVILTLGKLAGGSRFTARLARKLGKPCWSRISRCMPRLTLLLSSSRSTASGR